MANCCAKGYASRPLLACSEPHYISWNERSNSDRATRARLFLVVVVIGVAFSAACFVERLLRDYVRTAIQPNGEPSDPLVQRPLKLEDVIRSLRSEVKRAGSQRAFAKKAGVNVGVVSKTLRGIVLPSEKILDALKLRVVYLSK